MAVASFKQRIDALDWQVIERELDAHGYALTPRLLSAAEARQIVALYRDDARFRSTIDMEKHRFGRGQYRYFARPLPAAVSQLRTHLYRHLAPIANRWSERLSKPERFPATLDDFIAHCHAHGQERPTPLVLRYEAEGYNCLHQDLYGEIAFPLQAAVFLSQPERDYAGGEFLLVEQRPRRQSRGEAVTLGQGEAIVFPNAQRPVAGSRGFYRVKVRHGVSRLRAGARTTLGLIFHDAR